MKTTQIASVLASIFFGTVCLVGCGDDGPLPDANRTTSSHLEESDSDVSGDRTGNEVTPEDARLDRPSNDSLQEQLTTLQSSLASATTSNNDQQQQLLLAQMLASRGNEADGGQ